MKKKVIPAGLLVFLFLFTSLLSQKNNDQQSFQQLYDKAEKLFNSAATDSTDSVSLHDYTAVITQSKPNTSNAKMLYNCYERSGILKQGLGYDARVILSDYYSALALQKNYHLPDSLLFRLLLSAGNVHFTNAAFDSSVFYFSQAEKIINKHPSAGLAGDLYNSMGALYSEAGNYAQSGVYFNKALELTRQTHPELGDAIFAMSANVASAVRLSGYPDSSLRLYKKLLDTSHPSLAIINNISAIFLGKKQPDSALHYLQMSNNKGGLYTMPIHNAMAQAYMLKGATALASGQLHTAAALYVSASSIKSNAYGATQKYLGDLAMMENKPVPALHYYQQALIQYDAKFNDTNQFHNPGNFIGDFASYNLFDVLAAKAACFAALYNRREDEKFFAAAISTYDSAFALSDYIKKSIDNDEARLFIADKVFDAYKKAIDFLMNAHRQHDQDEIMHALEWISKSRATSLAISLKENTIQQYAGLPDSLLQKEKSIKISISRFKLQLAATADSAGQKALLSSINSASLQLQLLYNVFKEYPAYYHQKFATDKIDIRSVQKNILNDETAVICYFKGFARLYTFLIRKDKIEEFETAYDSALQGSLSTYLRALSEHIPGSSYDGGMGRFLYQKLVAPVHNNLRGVKSLIIIPDQDLINVPFEALQDADDKYLVENYDITYQYAIPFLQKNAEIFDKNKAIAFAPFAYQNSSAGLERLPSSLQEIASFAGNEQVIGKNATKANFLASAYKASVIHLATHAAVNFSEPENSYIAFYEQNQADSTYKMFAHELYNLRLPNTQLVFLSACETGSGKVSQSEGALSLSRAFAFAGCPNIVTSLWKAEDQSTAYLSEKFYDYVAKGYGYAQALQRAKKDLLNDKTMSQFHSPVYWSHLVFIGDVPQEKAGMHSEVILGWIILLVVLFIAAMVFFKRRKKSKPSST